MYESFEHTADVGLRITADSLPELFSEAGAGLYSLIVEDLDQIDPIQSRTYALEESDITFLLFDWLNELLFTFESEKFLGKKFEIQLNEPQLQATIWGEPFDPTRHELWHEVKAITYHQLSLKQQDDHWMAEVILDI